MKDARLHGAGGARRSCAHLAASAALQAWASGDVRTVHDLLAPDAHTVNPTFGHKQESRKEWEEMVADVFKVVGRMGRYRLSCCGQARVRGGAPLLTRRLSPAALPAALPAASSGR